MGRKDVSLNGVGKVGWFILVIDVELVNGNRCSWNVTS